MALELGFFKCKYKKLKNEIDKTLMKIVKSVQAS